VTINEFTFVWLGPWALHGLFSVSLVVESLRNIVCLNYLGHDSDWHIITASGWEPILKRTFSASRRFVLNTLGFVGLKWAAEGWMRYYYWAVIATEFNSKVPGIETQKAGNAMRFYLPILLNLMDLVDHWKVQSVHTDARGKESLFCKAQTKLQWTSGSGKPESPPASEPTPGLSVDRLRCCTCVLLWLAEPLQEKKIYDTWSARQVPGTGRTLKPSTRSNTWMSTLALLTQVDGCFNYNSSQHVRRGLKGKTPEKLANNVIKHAWPMVTGSEARSQSSKPKLASISGLYVKLGKRVLQGPYDFSSELCK